MTQALPSTPSGPASPPRSAIPTLAPDMLRGADEISEFLFGSRTERRKVYHLAETTRLPVFRLGSQLCARRSVLLDWMGQQEKRGM